MRFKPAPAASNPPLSELLHVDDAARKQFKGSPIKRVGRDRFVRNVLVAAGNSGDTALIACVEPLLEDASPHVRGMAVWAVRRLAGPGRERELKDKFASKERDLQVLAEWDERS